MPGQLERDYEKKQRVFVYSGPGTSQQLTPCLLNFYEQTHTVIQVDEKDVTLKNILPEDTHTAAGAQAGSSDDTIKKDDLLVIGAGNARIMAETYNEKFNSQNRSEFVSDLNKILDKGVHYSGICAGAIIACSHFSWLTNTGSLSEVCDTKFTLGRINVTAGFPYHTDGCPDLRIPSQFKVLCEVQSFSYGVQAQSRIDFLTLNTPAFFKNIENDASIKILASFHRDQPSTLDQPDNDYRNHRKHPMGIFSKPATDDSPAIFASAPHYEADPSFFNILKAHSTLPK